jgi:hypothetical protein
MAGSRQVRELESTVLSSSGLRIGPEMAKYIQRHVAGNKDTILPVIGGDARTGVPRREMIQTQILAREQTLNF